MVSEARRCVLLTGDHHDRLPQYNMNNSVDDYVKMDNEEEFMEENELIESFEEAKRASTEVASMYGGHETDEEVRVASRSSGLC